MAGRYTVEIQDDYGPCDFDYFDDARDAIDCAAGMDIAARAKVVDRQEQAIVWSAEQANEAA